MLPRMGLLIVRGRGTIICHTCASTADAAQVGVGEMRDILSSSFSLSCLHGSTSFNTCPTSPEAVAGARELASRGVYRFG